ncbi:WW domain-containing protein tag-325-like isoform X2 [Ornithodoros turicata]|uniref:WW domain-containing protein tag-325-like isoform X2 n=1 Tax=Ornithodoros turicata TaxID=34597 RepID=UPI00313952AB
MLCFDCVPQACPQEVSPCVTRRCSSSKFNFEVSTGTGLSLVLDREYDGRMCELATVLHDFRNDADNTYLCKGEQLQVLDKDSTHWWRVTRNVNNCKHDFYAPVRYLQLIAASTQEAKESPTCEKARRCSPSPQQKQATPVSVKSSKSSSSSLDGFDDSHALHSGMHIHRLSIGNAGGSSVNHSYESLDTEPEVDYYSDEGNLSCGSCQLDASGDSLPNGQKDSQKYDDSPIYANFPVVTPLSPPRPSPEDVPQRFLSDHWAEYVAHVGRKYYYNFRTGESSWKPPRRRNVQQGSLDDLHHSASLSDASPKPQRKAPPPLPPAKKKPVSRQHHEESPGTPPSPTHGVAPRGHPVRGQALQETTTAFQQNGNSTFYYVMDNAHGSGKWYSSVDEGASSLPSYDRPNNLPLASLSLEEEEEEEDEGKSIEDHTGSDSVNDRASSRKELGVAQAETSARPTSRYMPSLSLTPKLRRLKPTPPPTLPTTLEPKLSRALRTRSMILTEDLSLKEPNDEAFENLELVVRQGTLNKTELVKGGKKQKKSWSPAFMVLTNRHLFIYKDINSAQEFPQGKNAEIQINLAGAFVDWCPEKSKRRNVFQLSTVAGQKVLLQDDNMQTSKEWFDTISAAIKRLPNGLDMTEEWQAVDASSPPEGGGKRGKKAARSKSIRNTRSPPPSATSAGTTACGLGEDASTSPQERKNRIRNKLRQFFVRRPTLESLQEKGIFKDEPVFGCMLAHLCEKDAAKVPRFVRECVEEIERRDMTADGLYRASGNLSQVQKVRCHVNQDDYSVLADEEDIHVLTGALKMFFRHMKEPLFPFVLFNKFLMAISTGGRNGKLAAFKELLSEMPKPNYETLKYLLRHLLKVTEYSDKNRMHIQNLAIVFGPSLLASAEEVRDLAVDMMHQNRIIEFLLLEYNNLFL